MKKLLIPFICFCALASCKTEQPKEAPLETTSSKPIDINTPKFNADTAYTYIQQQVDFGPRVPNTKAHKACAEWLIQTLQNYADTLSVQKADLVAFDGTVLQAQNIIASFNPKAKQRILLAAHWDTRPFADHDENPSVHNTPILGANDGGSGVGVLLEIARAINNNPIGVGVDIILFDAEDYGQPEFSDLPQKRDTYCLGSQYWAKNKGNYSAEFGILLDMVGAKNATFPREGVSRYFASYYLDKVWGVALNLGFDKYFIPTHAAEITDDHLYINTIANIPTIDIIDYKPNGFFEHWHTQDDTMENISKETLNAVGQTVLEVIYRYDKGVF